MSSITITINASQQDFSTFADELGYMAEVNTLVNGENVASPNPQTKEQFLVAYFKNITVGELYRRKAAVLDQATADAKTAEKAALKSAIESVVSVTAVL